MFVVMKLTGCMICSQVFDLLQCISHVCTHLKFNMLVSIRISFVIYHEWWIFLDSTEINCSFTFLIAAFSHNVV